MGYFHVNTLGTKQKGGCKNLLISPYEEALSKRRGQLAGTVAEKFPDLLVLDLEAGERNIQISSLFLLSLNVFSDLVLSLQQKCWDQYGCLRHSNDQFIIPQLETQAVVHQIKHFKLYHRYTREDQQPGVYSICFYKIYT